MDAAMDGPIVVPMHRQGRLPVVELSINGKGPFRIGVDSGASVSLCLSDELVERLGLPAVGEVEMTDGTGLNPVRSVEYSCAEVRVGALTRADITAIAGLRSNPGLGEPIDGVAGLPLFGDVLVTFDYGRGEFRFEVGSLPESDGRTILACDPVEPVPTIRIMVGGVEVSAHLDTRNAQGISLPEAMAERLPLKDAPVVMGRGRTQFNEFEIKGARVSGPLTIGGHEFADPFVVFAAPFRTANVGAELLEQFTVTFDLANQRVKLVHNGGATLVAPTKRPPAPNARGADQLDSMVGAWRVEGKAFVHGPGAPPLELVGSAVWERDHGGKVVHERFTLDTTDGPRKGEAYLGLDARTGQYQLVQVDGFNPMLFLLVAGGRDASTGEITMDQFQPPGVAGQPELRWVYRFEKDGSFVKSMLRPDGRGGWEVRSEYRYVRE